MLTCILRHFSYKKHTLLHLMSALNFNKEEEITLVIHTNTHPSILKLIQKQKNVMRCKRQVHDCTEIRSFIVCVKG